MPLLRSAALLFDAAVAAETLRQTKVSRVSDFTHPLPSLLHFIRSFSPTKSLLVDTIRVVVDDMKVGGV